MSKIAEAITAVMADIKRLEKGDKNQHGGYKFASIDDFLDLTRPLCAKHGLAVFQDEVDCEIVETKTSKGPQQALMMRFAFTLECGEETRGPHHRSIMVPASMGSQAFGSAQSYALKQYLRSTFQIATGDTDDIDHHNTGELGKPAVQPKPRERMNGPFPTKTALDGAAKAFYRDLNSCGDQDMLTALLTAPDTQALKEQLVEYWPGWLNGDGMPDEFEPLNALIRRLKSELPEVGRAGINN